MEGASDDMLVEIREKREHMIVFAPAPVEAVDSESAEEPMLADEGGENAADASTEAVADAPVSE